MQYHGYSARVIAALLALLLYSTAALAQQPESIGRVVALQGQATVRHRGGVQLESLGLHSPVYPEDTLQTAVDAKLRLVLVDGTELTLGAQGSLTLSRFVYAPQQQNHHVLLGIAQGAFHAVTKILLPQASFEVHTTTTVAAVRGTEWLGEVSAESTAVFVVYGEVAVINADASVRGEVTLTPGMGTDVQRHTPPTPPKQWGAARVQALQQATALP
jgi:hypothetical protein